MKTLLNAVKTVINAKKEMVNKEIALLQSKEMQVFQYTELLTTKQWFVEELWLTAVAVDEVTISIDHLTMLATNTVTQSQERIEGADTDFPLLVTYLNGIPTIIDGRHRLAKLRQQGRVNCRVKVITLPQQADLEVCFTGVKSNTPEVYAKYQQRFHASVKSNLVSIAKKVLF